VPSRDGSIVAAIDNAWQIHLYDPRDWSKQPETLAPLPEEYRRGVFTLNDWSPDGRFLVGATGAGSFAYSRDTQTYRPPWDGPGNSASWLPDGHRLLFNRQGRLFVADWPSGQTREVFAITGETVSNPRLSLDGTYVYFEHGSASGDIWMVRFDEDTR
jgi:Tol biopolymer transport system component